MAETRSPAVPIEPLNLNVHAAAAYIGCTVSCLRQLAWRGKIATVRYGRRLLFPRTELDRYNNARLKNGE